jgi:DNA-binding NarL/FixJ family response regulator
MIEGGPVRLLLLDDHALFRQGLARVLAAEGGFVVVGECATVEEALGVIASTHVDLVLLDVDLGGEQGAEFLASARSSGFTGKVLVVTAGVSEGEASRLLRWGTDGIFLKHDSLPTLFEHISRVMAGESVLDPLSTRVLMRRIDNGSDAQKHPLTGREVEVLRCVLKGMTNKEIATQEDVSESTIKGNLQQLFNKMGVRTRAQLARVAVERHLDELETDSTAAAPSI